MIYGIGIGLMEISVTSKGTILNVGVEWRVIYMDCLREYNIAKI